VYGNGHTRVLGRAWRIYYGMWGNAPFQSRHETAPGLIRSLPLMPEWYLVIVALIWLAALGTLWRPLFHALPLLVVAVIAPIAQAILSGARAAFPWRAPVTRFFLRGLTALLHFLQPLARLSGRLRYDLTPWRRRGVRGAAVPRPRCFTLWSEHWQAQPERLHAIEAALKASGASVARGGNYDTWDLEVRDGVFGAVRARMATEDHGAGKQLARLRCRPTFSSGVVALVLVLLIFSAGAAFDHAWLASATIAGAAVIFCLRIFQDCATATAAVVRSLKELGFGETR